jgi:transposase
MARTLKKMAEWKPRPTKYKPEYAQQVLEHMREGYSLTAAAGKIGVWREQLYLWAGKFPEMAEAMKAGKAARVAKLEEGLLTYGGNKDGGRITARIFALKNAAPEEWCEESRVEVGGSIGVDVVVRIARPTRELDAEDLKLVE